MVSKKLNNNKLLKKVSKKKRSKTVNKKKSKRINGKKSNKVKKTKQILQYGGLPDFAYKEYETDNGNYREIDITETEAREYNYNITLRYNIDGDMSKNLITAIQDAVRTIPFFQQFQKHPDNLGRFFRTHITKLHQSSDDDYFINEYINLNNIVSTLNDDPTGDKSPPSTSPGGKVIDNSDNESVPPTTQSSHPQSHQESPPPFEPRQVSSTSSATTNNTMGLRLEQSVKYALKSIIENGSKSSNANTYVIIDMDLVFTDEVYNLCMDKGKLLSNRCECVKSIQESLSSMNRATFISKYFKHTQKGYDNFLTLLKVLKRLTGFYVVLTSTKLPKTILKAFLSLVRNITGDIVFQLLRDNDLQSKVQNSRPEYINSVKCKTDNYSFLNNYIFADDYPSDKTAEQRNDSEIKSKPGIAAMIVASINNLATVRKKRDNSLTALFVTNRPHMIPQHFVVDSLEIMFKPIRLDSL